MPFWGMRPKAKRTVALTLRASDIRTILSGLEILHSDEPKWQAEIEEIAGILKQALNANRASVVLPARKWTW